MPTISLSKILPLNSLPLRMAAATTDKPKIIAPPAFLPLPQGMLSDRVNNFDPEFLIPGFVDLLEKEISAKNATKPHARRYVSLVSVFIE